MSRERFIPERIIRSEYRFASPNTLLFVTGAPFSGKSTLAPLIAASIEGCGLQSMDIIRLVAQEMESQKPESARSPFVNYGSCDSYLAIGDGAFSPKSLIQGFNEYSQVMGTILEKIIPKLELQGARDVLFEGVQLTPLIVEQYLRRNGKLIVIVTNPLKAASNRDHLIAGNKELMERYSIERLILIQKEILEQAKRIPQDKIIYIDNLWNIEVATSRAITRLLELGVITQ